MYQAIRRVASHYPVYLQHTCASPYFDHSLFSYDERVVSKLSKMYGRGDQGAKFYSKETKQKLFSCDGEGEKFVWYVFHPTDAFCLVYGVSGKAWMLVRGN